MSNSIIYIRHSQFYQGESLKILKPVLRVDGYNLLVNLTIKNVPQYVDAS